MNGSNPSADRPHVGFGLMFFAANSGPSAEFYDFVLRVARYADDRFGFISTPERHFHPFGGAFPNPAVMSAAIAAVTDRIQIRAGSLIAPLHNLIRIVEDWALLDNLSGGRVAIAFGTGWNIDDFVLAPDNFADRRAILRDMIRAAREMWETGRFSATNPAGQSVSLELFPRPVRPQLNGWLTVSRSLEGFVTAGEEGLNVLTHLETQDVSTLAHHISEYRLARARHGHDPCSGVVTVMQHTLIGDRSADVERVGRKALNAYLTSAADLEARAVRHGGVMSGGRDAAKDQTLIVDPRLREEMVTYAGKRFLRGASLIGTLEECEEQVARLAEAGVDEIACLIDFMSEEEAVWSSLASLAQLQARFFAAARKRQQDLALARFLGSDDGAADRPTEVTT
jgi:natural product biosynthesis luciferase-like monooxygenase protein